MILLLTADTPESLLPTIVSRCEVLRLRPLAVERLAGALASAGRPPRRRRAAWRTWQAGAPATLCACWRTRMRWNNCKPGWKTCAGCWGQPSASVFPTPNNFQKSGTANETGTNCAGRCKPGWGSGGMCCCAAAGAGAPLTNLDWQAEIQRLAAQISLAEARARMRDLERGLARLDANVNPRLLAEVILLDWPRIG